MLRGQSLDYMVEPLGLLSILQRLMSGLQPRARQKEHLVGGSLDVCFRNSDGDAEHVLEHALKASLRRPMVR